MKRKIWCIFCGKRFKTKRRTSWHLRFHHGCTKEFSGSLWRKR